MTTPGEMFVTLSATITEAASPEVMAELRAALIHIHGVPEDDLPANDTALFQEWVEVVVANAAVNEREIVGSLADCAWKYHHQHPYCAECGGGRPGPCCSIDDCACDAAS